ncbi:DNA mismatch repair protein MutS [Desulforhopalus singaporensis]|uniref:DNA mismatch repair protein MutS n=1 Tax=Desulforhopalus singaporensis TaxID=91360 RepID=A0A1H0JPU0_9BACT|nr:DNA mismatch repair protein MutS [Desulforhopalus singaporensis]SDO45594.1 DNA mismatch repair protein MutS [Desulforhopalus singaporensis]
MITASKEGKTERPVKLTPMLQQYMDIKQQHEDAILFYRMGDFYEMFFEDAVIASKILNITLTSRNKKSDPVQVPMCGIPYHAVQNYLSKLIEAGQRVAICEQVEDPADAKGIVKRDVIRIVSPGVVTDDQLLDDKSNNYICALNLREKGKSSSCGVSFLDISTGEFLIGEYSGNGQELTDVLDQVTRLQPAELLVAQNSTSVGDTLLGEIKALLPRICITSNGGDSSGLDSVPAAREMLCDHFSVVSLDGFGCATFNEGVLAAATLLDHVRKTQKTAVGHIEKLTPIETGAILHLDEASRRNLELTQTIVGASRQGSLISILDQTCTPMGARLLKNHLLFPLQQQEKIISRLDATTYFFKNSHSRKELRALLESVYDLERLNSRMTLGSGNGRDMIALKTSLSALPQILSALKNCDTSELLDIRSRFDCLTDLYDLLEQAIAEDSPVTLREGNLIKQGYNKELDELVALQRDGKKLILELENKERSATGIAKLKVGFNRVFGYFIEVSKVHSDKVPEHYIRKQTLVNAERFITAELKEFEEKVLGAQDQRVELEYNLFVAIRDRLAASSSRLLQTANLLARLDVLLNNGEVAHRYNYRRPEINGEDVIEIVEGRHPVIERMMPSGEFVPNDVYLDQKKDEVLIITGPNMAGKSTVLRQTALIVLMAQMGCYVPAESAKIGIVDRIFTRVGAMDNLRQGQSTFMVEMSETANILNNSTERSLVILDEIGRGTSTYDGLSIAWAVAENLVNKNERGVKTLFATHYHELTELAKSHSRVRNYSIGVREWRGNIIFLHKLVKGGTSRSYGIQVAALAGVPQEVVLRAKEILKDIELGKFAKTTGGEKNPRITSKNRKHPDQLSLFSPPPDRIHELLDAISPDECSPMEALNTLYRLKELRKQ